MAAVRLNNAFVAANLAIDPGLIYRGRAPSTAKWKSNKRISAFDSRECTPTSQCPAGQAAKVGNIPIRSSATTTALAWTTVLSG